MIFRNFAAIAVGVCLVMAGCSSAGEHRAAIQDNSGTALTVGNVQREIRVGMPGSRVLEVLGSPNIVSSDEERREVWVYDKISTEKVYSTDSGGVSSLILGGGLIGDGLLGGAGSAGYSKSAGAAATTQKTLTVIIKFDAQGKVRDFAYHTSRF